MKTRLRQLAARLWLRAEVARVRLAAAQREAGPHAYDTFHWLTHPLPAGQACTCPCPRCQS